MKQKFLILFMLLSFSACAHAMMIIPTNGQHVPKPEDVKAELHKPGANMYSTAMGNMRAPLAPEAPASGGVAGVNSSAAASAGMRNNPPAQPASEPAIAKTLVDDNPSTAPLWGLAGFALVVLIGIGFVAQYSKKINNERKTASVRATASMDKFEKI